MQNLAQSGSILAAELEELEELEREEGLDWADEELLPQGQSIHPVREVTKQANPAGLAISDI